MTTISPVNFNVNTQRGKKIGTTVGAGVATGYIAKNAKQLFKDIPQVRYAPDIVFTYNMPVLPKQNRILISCIYNDNREEMESFNNKDYADKMISLCRYYLS